VLHALFRFLGLLSQMTLSLGAPVALFAADRASHVCRMVMNIRHTAQSSVHNSPWAHMCGHRGICGGGRTQRASEGERGRAQVTLGAFEHLYGIWS